MEDIIDTNQQAPMPSNTPYFDGNLPNANATLVLGIISIATCWMYAIPGIVCGIIAIVLHKKNKAIYLTDPQMFQRSFKNSTTGNTCAIIGLSLSILFILLLVGYMIFVFTYLVPELENLSRYNR